MSAEPEVLHLERDDGRVTRVFSQAHGGKLSPGEAMEIIKTNDGFMGRLTSLEAALKDERPDLLFALHQDDYRELDALGCE